VQATPQNPENDYIDVYAPAVTRRDMLHRIVCCRHIQPSATYSKSGMVSMGIGVTRGRNL